MGRSVHPREQSPLIRGGMFSQSNKRQRRIKEEPSFKETIRDYRDLLEDLLRALTEVVDRAFPSADFLCRNHIAGSMIEPNTRLSFIIRTFLGLSQMTLKSDIVKNYQQTLKKHLDTIQHNPTKKTEYTELLNIIKVYQNLSNAMTKQQQMRSELLRLEALDLASKTIDRRLKIEWIDPCMRQPIAELTTQIAKAMQSSKYLQSAELAGRNNSLAGLSRLAGLVTTSSYSTQKKKQDIVTKEPQSITASAA